MTAIRFAWRELRGGLAGFRIFLLCLMLGVAAIAGIGQVKSAILAGLERDGAVLLGGDAEMRFTYRFADDVERAWMNQYAQGLSVVTDFRSMVVVGDERALTQVKSVDDAYPLVGQVVLDPPMALPEALADNGAVMQRVLADRLGLKPGDSFMLGTGTYHLSAILETEPDGAAGGFSLGPRTIVLTEALEQSGLLTPGTLFETRYRLKFGDDPNLEGFKDDAMSRFAASGVRWTDARDGAPGIAEFIDRLGSFLVLVGLSGLAVGGVGISAAVRAYLARKTPVIATLKTLGASKGTIFATYALQIGALTLVGVGLGLALALTVPLVLAPIITAALPVPAAFAIYPSPLVEAALYGVLTAAIFSLWPLARAEDTAPATLFRDSLSGASRWPAARYLLSIVALLFLLTLTAMAYADNMRLTLATLGGILGALLILTLAASVIRRLAAWLRPLAKRPTTRLALGAIGARNGDTAAVMLSLGLGLSVLAAVGQIDGTLRNSIQQELPEVAPSYFFVDIQPDQMDGFRARLDDPQVSKMEAAPMLRGIITQINGKPAKDVAGEHWVLQGDRGVTYADAMPEGTTITSGDWWAEGYTGENLISFAAEEGQEMGLKLGDTLTLNILGRDISGKIASFREVNFENAGIGFILSFNQAALAGAPHSWMATVYAEEEAEAPILRDLASAYPNITAIRVRDAIDQVAVLLGGIASAIRWGAAVTLLTGFAVLIGAALAGETARTYEAAIMKSLGATRREMLLSFALRSLLMGLAAGAVALLAGVLGAWSVMTFVMDMDYRVIWPSALTTVLAGIALTLVAGLVFALRPLAAKPARVLRARE